MGWVTPATDTGPSSLTGVRRADLILEPTAFTRTRGVLAIFPRGEGGGRQGRGDINSNDALHHIVHFNCRPKAPPVFSPSKDFQATDAEETCVIDSGVCGAVLTPQAFPNMKLEVTSLPGQK